MISFPMRMAHTGGKPSVDSTRIVPSPVPTGPASRVMPRASTPVALPLTSMLIWSGRLPRTSTDTWLQTPWGSPGIPAPVAMGKRSSETSWKAVSR